MKVAGITMYGRGRITIVFNKRVKKLIRMSEQDALITLFSSPNRKSSLQTVADADKLPRIVITDRNWLITGFARPTLIIKNR